MRTTLYKLSLSALSGLNRLRHDMVHYEHRCYISGATTSRLSTIEESFACARDFAFIAERVKKMGYIAVVPLGMCPSNWPYWKIMVHVCWKLILCKTVYFMDNWRTSKDCRIENILAKITMKKCIYEESFVSL